MPNQPEYAEIFIFRLFLSKAQHFQHAAELSEEVLFKPRIPRKTALTLQYRKDSGKYRCASSLTV